MASNPVLPITNAAGRPGVNSRPPTRASTRLSRKDPAQYLEQPAGLPVHLTSTAKARSSTPNSRKRKSNESNTPAKRRRVTKATNVDRASTSFVELPVAFNSENQSLKVIFHLPTSRLSRVLSLPSSIPSSVVGTVQVPKTKRSRPARQTPKIESSAEQIQVPQKKPAASAKRTPKTKPSAEQIPDTRPDPCGIPPAWAPDRPSLGETLRWLRSPQGGGYSSGKYGLGYVIDGDSGDRRYMDHEIIITRAGGGKNVTDKKTGTVTQTTDHDRTNAQLCSFTKSMEDQIAIGCVVGVKNKICPTKPLHRLSVLDWFHLTAIWAEKVNGRLCFKYRFEKIHLNKKSWWAPVGSADPPTTRDFVTKALRQTCTTCHHRSPKVYKNGWMCLHEQCKNFWELNGTEPPSDMEFNPAFLEERTLYADVAGLPALLPDLPDPVADTLISTERNSWKGLVCPKCSACTARAHWDAWRCETEGCGYVLPVQHTLRSYRSLLLDHQSEITGRALSLDTWKTPIQAPATELLGYWRIQTFTIPGMGTVTHFQSNAHINRKAGGADDILKELQEADLKLCRHKMKCSVVQGTRTAHFTHDYGVPYDYIVGQENTALQHAPAVIQKALGRMIWAGRHHAKDTDFVPYNEVLALGYLQDGEIGYHDDGEESLAGTIATMSIGSDADMHLRFKGKYHFAKKLSKYDPTVPIYEGFEEYKARLALKAVYDKGDMEVYKQAEQKFLKMLEDKKPSRERKTPPDILTLNLKHGDFVVMSGEELQKYTEHSVVPNSQGKMRYALTARSIRLASIPEKEHWKGEFILPNKFFYDGDVSLVAEVQAARLARENMVEHGMG